MPRLLRGTVAATTATFVALFSHIAGGGEAPGWLGVVAPWVLSVTVCTLLAGRALSLLRLSLAVAASQLLFHSLFVLGLPSSVSSSVTHGVHSGHGAPLELSATTTAAVMHHGGSTMWLWHMAAAAVTVAMVHRGERALSRLRGIATRAVSWARRRLLPGITFLTTEKRGVLTAVSASDGPRSPGPVLTSILRRGPPLLSPA